MRDNAADELAEDRKLVALRTAVGVGLEDVRLGRIDRIPVGGERAYIASLGQSEPAAPAP